MWGFLAGFLLGAATGWLWLPGLRRKDAPSFPQMLYEQMAAQVRIGGEEKLKTAAVCPEGRPRSDPERERMMLLFGRAGQGLPAGRRQQFYPESGGSPESKREQVFRLREKGYRPEEIARETRLGRGEVELILSLRLRAEQRGMSGSV